MRGRRVIDTVWFRKYYGNLNAVAIAVLLDCEICRKEDSVENPRLSGVI